MRALAVAVVAALGLRLGPGASATAARSSCRRMRQRAGKKGRVPARVFYRRAASRALRHRTVSKRSEMCRVVR